MALKTMKLSCRLLCYCALLLAPASASASEAALAFKDFPSAQVDVAKPAPPKVGAGKARRFRTALRDEAPKGPNFAGHFTFVSWGCGVACQEFAIVDAITGDVHFPSELRLNAYDAITDETEPFQFQLDSRLFVLAGAPNDEEATGVFYYEWTGTDFKLLKATPKTWPR